MKLHVEEQICSDIFVKHHIVGIPGVAVHEFLEAEPLTADAHDHPGDFDSYVLKGWFTERVWERDEDTGLWGYCTIHHPENTCYRVKAEHIHQIVDMSEGGCVTVTFWKPVSRTWRFWRFDNGTAQYREHDKDEWIDA